MSSREAKAERYHLIMEGNALRIFSEPNASRRLAALRELWAADGMLIEHDAVAKGYGEISESVGTLLSQLPNGTVFAPIGKAAGHHGVARLRWQATSADGVPGPASGTDIAFLDDGRISKLYVILDPVA